MFKVVCVGAFHRKGIELLESRPDQVTYEVLTDLSPENVARGVAGADAVVVRTTPLPRETLERADRLRIVSRHGVGTDNVDVAYLSSRKIPMAIAIDSNVGSVAEHTLMMLLALAKDAMAGDRATRSGDFAWRDRRTASDVAGKSALIMGFGRIGQRVGALCRALGLRVAAFDPYMERSPVEGVELVKDFRAILPETDFLCLHLPSTPETRDLIGAGELALLKRGAFVINCARGGIVDEDVLCDALESGHLGGAGLDVFAKEPPDTAHRLFRQEKVLLSPHNAALTEECAIRMATQAVQNVLDCLDGKLQTRVVMNRREIGMA